MARKLTHFFYLISILNFACSHTTVERGIASKDKGLIEEVGIDSGGKKHHHSSDGSVKEESAGVESWVTVGPNGEGVVRALAYNGRCPAASVNGIEKGMSVHAEADQSFPYAVCELKTPAGAVVAVNNQHLPIVPSHPKKILVIGDTGCRIKTSKEKTKAQHCQDPAKWPFKRVAEAAASLKPELVVHVGDYHYREAACPDEKKCGQAAYGDNFASWDEDFFTPGAALIRIAPWIFVRGNHEACARAHEGFFKLLDPRADHVCEKASTKTYKPSAAYAVKFRNLAISVLDSPPVSGKMSHELKMTGGEI